MYLSTDTVQGHTILAGGEAEIIVLGSVPTHYRIDKSGQRSVSITFWPKPQLWSFPAKGGKGRVPKGVCVGPEEGLWEQGREEERQREVRRKRASGGLCLAGSSPRWQRPCLLSSLCRALRDPPGPPVVQLVWGGDERKVSASWSPQTETELRVHCLVPTPRCKSIHSSATLATGTRAWATSQA